MRPMLSAASQAILLVGTALVVGCSRGESGMMAGYSDFVRFGGITYDAVYPEAAGDIAGKVDRSVVHARTKVQMQGTETERPGSYFRNGDAGQLEPGTRVYRLEGYDPEFRLAAHFDGGWNVYEASRNPEAATGEDLMDVRGGVRRVDVYETDISSAPPRGPRFLAGTTRRGSVKGPEEVASFEDQLLRAPVERLPETFVGDYYIALRLQDGTVSAGAYDPVSGRLSSTVGGEPQGVVVPAGPKRRIDALLGNALAEGKAR